MSKQISIHERTEWFDDQQYDHEHFAGVITGSDQLLEDDYFLYFDESDFYPEDVALSDSAISPRKEVFLNNFLESV